MHTIDFDPRHVTLLRPHDGRPMTKTWTQTTAGPVVQAFNNVAWYEHRGSFTVHNYGSLLTLLNMAKDDPSLFVIRGELRTDVEPQTIYTIGALPRTSKVVDGKLAPADVPTPVLTLGTRKLVLRRLTAFVDVPRYYGMIDVDDVEWSEVGLSAPDYTARGAELVWRHVIKNLPNAENIGCVYQWSSSAGVKDGARLHFIVITDEPRDGEWWARLYEATGRSKSNAAGARLCKNGSGSFDFDVATMRPVQPNYIADPLFVGMEDPIEDRYGVIPGVEFPTVLIEQTMLTRPMPTFATDLKDATRIELHNTRTGTRTATYARGDVHDDWRDLVERLGPPVRPELGLQVIEPHLKELREAGYSEINGAIFSVTAKLRNTLALELLGVDALLDALVGALDANPASCMPSETNRSEFNRALAYAFSRYEPIVIPENDVISAHKPVVVNQQFLDPALLATEHRVVVVRSPMGTGKSVAIDTYAKSVGFDVLRAISPRRSLVRDVSSKWGIAHYQDDSTTSAHLSTTLHSLHKTPSKLGELLVLDESEQHTEALLREADRPDLTLASLRDHANSASKIILADAHAGWQTSLLLELLSIDPSEVLLIDNHWRPSARDITLITSSQDAYTTASTTVMERLKTRMKGTPAIPASEVKDPETGKLVKIPAVPAVPPVPGLYYLASTSKGQAEALDVYFAREVPQARRLLITQDTASEPNVVAWYADPNGESLKYDMIITSPSVQSGVSITVPVALSVLFGRMGDWTSPNKAVQQLGRARNAGERWWVLDHTSLSPCVSVERILENWKAARVATFGNIPVRGADGLWASIPQHEDLLLAAARMEARQNLDLRFHDTRIRQILEECEGYNIVVDCIFLDEQQVKEQKKVRQEVRAMREARKIAEAAVIFATPCPTEVELSLLLDKKERTQDEQRATTHGLAARCLGEAPKLRDLERTQTDAQWYRKATTLGLMRASEDDLTLLRVQELERVIDGHTSSLKLHKSQLTDVLFMRDVIAAAEVGFLLDETTTEEKRTYDPATHYTPEREEAIAEVYARYGRTLSYGNGVHSTIHLLLNTHAGIKLERLRKKDDPVKYVVTHAAIKSALRWTAGTTVALEQAVRRATARTPGAEVLTSLHEYGILGHVAIPEADQTPLVERVVASAIQRQNTNNIAEAVFSKD